MKRGDLIRELMDEIQEDSDEPLSPDVRSAVIAHVYTLGADEDVLLGVWAAVMARALDHEALLAEVRRIVEVGDQRRIFEAGMGE